MTVVSPSKTKKGEPRALCLQMAFVADSESILGYGNTVAVMHGSGYTSVYAHLSDISVKTGAMPFQAKQVSRNRRRDRITNRSQYFYFELWKLPERLNTRRWLTRNMN